MNTITIQEDYIRAGSSDTSTVDLMKLAHSPSAAVRRRVGENERTPSDLLEVLSRDSEPEVRIAVGLGSRTPENIIAKLVTDAHADVRFWLASASFLPKKFLEQLADDPNPYVEDRATCTLKRLSNPSGMLLNVFELLSEDHGWILKKLEALTQNYSAWTQQTLAEKTSEIVDDIRKHLERRRTLCAHWFDEQSGVPDDISRKCLVDQEILIDQTSWLLAHGVAEPDSLNQLNILHGQIRSHKEFIENELFVEIRKHVPQSEIDAINDRLNRSDGLFSLGYKDFPSRTSARLVDKVVVRSQPGNGFKQKIQVGSHSWECDATREEGGSDASPDPHSYLFGALGACTSITLLMYAQRHGWDLRNVVITVSQEEMATSEQAGHHQVQLIRDIVVEGALSDEQLARLKIVANKCPIHKLLVGSKEIKTNLELGKSPVGKS